MYHPAYKSLPNGIFPTIVMLFWLMLMSLLWPGDAPAKIKDVNLRHAVESLKAIDGITEQDVDQHLPVLKKFSYTEKRVFQALAGMPTLHREDVNKIVGLVWRFPIRFNQMTLLEYYLGLPDISLDLAAKLLKRLTETTFVLERALAAIPESGLTSCPAVLAVIDLILPLEETGLWCARQLFTLAIADDDIIIASLGRIAEMTDSQQRAAEKYLSGRPERQADIPFVLDLIARLSESDSYNAQALFAGSQANSVKISNWLTEFFLLPTDAREDKILASSPAERRELLHMYDRAAGRIIWRINSLHSVTNKFGTEIGLYWLGNMPEEELLELFQRLHPKARETFGPDFEKAVADKDRKKAVSLLQAATATARRQTAEDLTSANIYLLLANGGQLYDSSFRDILVPVFKKKLDALFRGDLLRFLRETDSDNEFAADLITNLAQKGKLTALLPASSNAQQQLVELMMDSALHNENSLLLFSATFPNLLGDLTRQARKSLLERLYGAAADTTTLGQQVRTILQHYHHRLPELLTAQEKRAIQAILEQHGEVDLTPYTSTPFPEWLADGRLRSLSTFPKDDDGWASYISYCQYLLDHGYKPALADDYDISPLTDALRRELTETIDSLSQAPTRQLSALFRLAGSAGFVVDWHKTVNRTLITQSIYIYSGGRNQERLLETFLKHGDEMFIQRGHSYYRQTQLLTPLSALLKDKRIDTATLQARQRFISLGSCGGIRAYNRLNELFQNKVDIFGSIGTGTTTINNPYNLKLLEVAAANPSIQSWGAVEEKIAQLFTERAGPDYIQPGSLPAVLHKMRGAGR